MAQAYAVSGTQGIFFSLDQVNPRPAASQKGASSHLRCNCSLSIVQPSAKNSPTLSLSILRRRNAVRESCVLKNQALWRLQKISKRASVVAEAGGDAETTTASRPTEGPPSAKECVEEGLKLFQKGRIRDALSNFDRALDLSPKDEEAQAALYNKACCHVQREEWGPAYDALRVSLSTYNLKFSTILNDPDMAPFRATKEFTKLRNQAREGGQEIGQGYRRDLKLISEVQAPFRGVRLFAYAGLSAAAGIATLFTIPRLINAVKGGEGALPLLPELQNIGIDIGGIAVFVALFIWDKRKENEQLERIARDETLSRLPLRLQSGKLVELSQLRENTRPLILVGDKASLERTLKKAERYRTELLARGVLICPLAWGAGAEQLARKPKGFAPLPKKVKKASPTMDDFESRLKAQTAKSIGEVERRYRAEVVSPAEWEQWVREQQSVAKDVKPGEDVYIILRLDGRVRRSGRGMPDWEGILGELPELDSVLSKLER